MSILRWTLFGHSSEAVSSILLRRHKHEEFPSGWDELWCSFYDLNVAGHFSVMRQHVFNRKKKKQTMKRATAAATTTTATPSHKGHYYFQANKCTLSLCIWSCWVQYVRWLTNTQHCVCSCAILCWMMVLYPPCIAFQINTHVICILFRVVSITTHRLSMIQENCQKHKWEPHRGKSCGKKLAHTHRSRAVWRLVCSSN